MQFVGIIGRIQPKSVGASFYFGQCGVPVLLRLLIDFDFAAYLFYLTIETFDRLHPLLQLLDLSLQFLNLLVLPVRCQSRSRLRERCSCRNQQSRNHCDDWHRVFPDHRNSSHFPTLRLTSLRGGAIGQFGHASALQALVGGSESPQTSTIRRTRCFICAVRYAIVRDN